MHNGHGGSSTEYNLPIRLHSPVRQTTPDLRRNSDSEEEVSQIPNLATDVSSREVPSYSPKNGLHMKFQRNMRRQVVHMLEDVCL